MTSGLDYLQKNRLTALKVLTGSDSLAIESYTIRTYIDTEKLQQYYHMSTKPRWLTSHD